MRRSYCGYGRLRLEFEHEGARVADRRCSGGCREILVGDGHDSGSDEGHRTRLGSEAMTTVSTLNSNPQKRKARSEQKTSRFMNRKEERWWCACTE